MLSRLLNLLAFCAVLAAVWFWSPSKLVSYMSLLLAAAWLWLRIEYSDPTKRNSDAARNQSA